MDGGEAQGCSAPGGTFIVVPILLLLKRKKNMTNLPKSELPNLIE